MNTQNKYEPTNPNDPEVIRQNSMRQDTNSDNADAQVQHTNKECTTCGLLQSTVEATGKGCLPNMKGHNFPDK